MGLTKCKDCGAEVSTKANTCLKCGWVLSEGDIDATKKTLVIVAGLILIVVVIVMSM